MHRLIVMSLAAAGVSVGLTAATAADISPAPVFAKAPIAAAAPFSWSGFYLGAQGGAGWGTTTDDVRSFAVNPISGDNFSATAITPQDQINGWHGGFTAGYNWQVNQLVLGVEGDWSFADISGKGDCSDLPNRLNPDIICSRTSKLGNFATIDGRVGFAVDHALVYVKGGAAYGHFTQAASAEIPFIPPFGVFSASATDNRWGVTAGVGVEYAFARNWSAKLEYDYLDFGTRTVTLNGSVNPNAFGAPASVSVTDSIREQVSVVRAGVNYRFDSGR
jgi:outer membrane immunogenic protein